MKTDRLLEMAKAEWEGIVKQLWTASGKPVDSVRFAVYTKSLEAVPLGLLKTAVNNLLKSHIYATVPQLGEVWLAINNELRRIGCYSIEAWMNRQGTGVYHYVDGELEEARL